MNVRIFKSKAFARIAKKVALSDQSLCRAIRDAERGLIAADLGGGVIKQRVARDGGGKSGGFRTLILFRAGDRSVFMHGFAKNAKGNIDEFELTALRKLASAVFAYDAAALALALANQTLIEVTCDEETLP